MKELPSHHLYFTASNVNTDQCQPICRLHQPMTTLHQTTIFTYMQMSPSMVISGLAVSHQPTEHVRHHDPVMGCTMRGGGCLVEVVAVVKWIEAGC
eukprot:SAG25_NODE_25_length_21717_cov_29.421778_19_plen_96_part_00